MDRCGQTTPEVGFPRGRFSTDVHKLPQRSIIAPSVQILPIAFDYLFVPVEGFFAAALHGAAAAVVEVDVDEAVALAHLAGGGGDEVNGTPGGVSPELNAVEGDRVAHCFDVVAKVVDAVVVDDRAVGLYFVIGAEAVFHDEKRESIAVVEVV